MSNLTEHAKRELELAGLNNESSTYDGMVAASVMAIVDLFAAQGHSGASASVVLDILERVLRFKPLTDLTNNPNEWIDVSYGGKPTWQNMRCPSVFSNDGGQTWYDIDARAEDKPLYQMDAEGRVKMICPECTGEHKKAPEELESNRDESDGSSVAKIA